MLTCPACSQGDPAEPAKGHMVGRQLEPVAFVGGLGAVARCRPNRLGFCRGVFSGLSGETNVG
jgi:hypothetical protein